MENKYLQNGQVKINKMLLDKFEKENIAFRRERIEISLDNGEYVSVNSFRERRRKEATLARLNSLYLDLDIQKDINSDFSIHNKESIESYCDMVDNRCRLLSIPLPSRIICSGRGLHIYWDLATFKKGSNFDDSDFEIGLSPNVINAYKFLQKQLIYNFKDLGADSACKDVSRVLRKVGTPTKNGGITHVCRIYDEKITHTEQNEIDRLFGRKSYLSIQDFATLFPYSYDSYTDFANVTEKQKEFFNDLQNEGRIHYNVDIKKLNKFTIEKYITAGVKKRPATQRQIETIKKYNKTKLSSHKLNNLTMAEADYLIKSSISNFNYIEKYLNEVFQLDLIGEGNRAMFTYYYAIGQRMLYPNLDLESLLMQTMEKWEKFQIDLPNKEVRKIMLSGFNYDGPGIRKATLVEQFEGIYLISNYKKKNVTKNNAQKIEELIKKDIVENTQRSLREIARELGVSHTYIKKIKDRFFKRTKRTLDNLLLNKVKMTDELSIIAIANEVFELTYANSKIKSSMDAMSTLYTLKLFGTL